MARTHKQVMASLPAVQQEKIRSRTAELIALENIRRDALSTQIEPVKKSATLAVRMQDFIGCDTSDAFPPDAARRHKEISREAVQKNQARVITSNSN